LSSWEPDVAETPPSKVQLCGVFFVEIDGHRCDEALPGRQGRLLFAYLTVHRNRPVERSRLVDVLWPTDPPRGAETTLRGIVFRMRQALGEGCLTGTTQVQLRLPEGVWVDVEAAHGAIHEAESAIGRGMPKNAWLPARLAHSIADAGFLPGFEGEWIEARRRALAEVSLRALDCIAEVALQLGGAEAPAAERAGRALIEAAPFRESGYRHLIRALAASGNLAEAMRVYDDACALFREELGISPSGSLRDLHAGLLEQHRRTQDW
jgi:DNA-binding SARP family transcriptional activator